MRRIIKSKPLLQKCPTCGKFTELDARPPAGLAAHDLHQNVAGGVTQLSQLASKPSRPLQIGSSPMIGKLAPQGGQQRTRPVQRRRELPCLGVNLAQLRRTPALARDERLSEGDPQIELGFAAPIAVGQGGKQC